MKVVTKKNELAKASDKTLAKKPAAKKAGTKRGVVKMDVEPDGVQARLPGQPRLAVKELLEFAVRHEETKAAHKLLTQQLKDEGEEGVGLYHKHKPHFEDDGAGGKIYTNGEWEVIVPSESLKIRTRHVA